MGIPSVLLICGSRALAGTDGETWARRVITARIAELPADGLVLHGACPASPDEWAGEIAAARKDLVVRAFHADGRHEGQSAGARVWGQWRDTVRVATTWEHFKERNIALVKATIAASERRECRAIVICLAASASKTQGGPWTANYAREQGLESHTWAWP